MNKQPGLMKKMRDSVDRLQARLISLIKENENLRQERDRYHDMAVYAGYVMEHSKGVAGFTGKEEVTQVDGVTPWDDLFTTGQMQAMFDDYKLKTQKEVYRELLNMTCPVSGPVIPDEKSRQAIESELSRLQG